MKHNMNIVEEFLAVLDKLKITKATSDPAPAGEYMPTNGLLDILESL